MLLTDAELDHTMGLLLLREGPGITLHATDASFATLTDGTGFLPTLERYTQVERHRVVPGETVALGERLSYRAFDVPTVKKARFGGGVEDEGRVVGYRLTDTATGRSAVYLPGVQEVTPAVHEELAGADVVLVDGTTWTDDEMIRLGLASKTARDMGHLAVDGPDGSLAVLTGLRAERRDLRAHQQHEPDAARGLPRARRGHRPRGGDRRRRARGGGLGAHDQHSQRDASGERHAAPARPSAPRPSSSACGPRRTATTASTTSTSA